MAYGYLVWCLLVFFNVIVQKVIVFQIQTAGFIMMSVRTISNRMTTLMYANTVFSERKFRLVDTLGSKKFLTSQQFSE